MFIAEMNISDFEGIPIAIIALLYGWKLYLEHHEKKKNGDSGDRRQSDNEYKKSIVDALTAQTTVLQDIHIKSESMHGKTARIEKSTDSIKEATGRIEQDIDKIQDKLRGTG